MATTRTWPWTVNRRKFSVASILLQSKEPDQKIRSKRRLFTPSEDELIVQLRQKGLHWRSIATALQRPSTSVKTRFYNTTAAALYSPETPPDRRRYFTKDEDNTILSLKAAGVTYKTMASTLRSRTTKSIQQRHFKLDRKLDDARATPLTQRRKRRLWTDSDVQKLKHLREVEGLKWRKLHELHFPDVAPATLAAKYQWIETQRSPFSKRVRYSSVEDEKLRQLRRAGLSWPQIGLEMPQRSLQGLKTRWFCHLRLMAEDSRRSFIYERGEGSNSSLSAREICSPE